MKTLKIALFIIFGSLITLHSYAQELKKEKKAKIRMEVIDDDGNKKVIDTTFSIDSEKDYKKVIQQMKEQAGYSEKEIALMKSELKEHAKLMTIDLDVMMEDFDKEKMHEHLMIVREKMDVEKEVLKEVLEDLKVELEGMEMNKEAMQKLEKAMKELQQVEWAEHSKLLNDQMKGLHRHFDSDANVFIVDGDHSKKDIWVDKNGEKTIVIKMNIDKDSLLSKENFGKIIFIGEDDDEGNVWVDQNGETIQIKKFKKGGNAVFFGDEADLEKIEELDGDHRVIVKKLRGEAAKGNAFFISDDAEMVKEFKDKDGNVKVFRYKMKSADGEEKENRKNKYKKVTLSISPANEDEIALATSKGFFKSKAVNLMLNNFTFDIDNEITRLGATFEEKGKLSVQIFDKEMNKLWKKKAGKVQGEWSSEIPAGILKEKGVYFLYFVQGKKAKLLKMANI